MSSQFQCGKPKAFKSRSNSSNFYNHNTGSPSQHHNPQGLFLVITTLLANEISRNMNAPATIGNPNCLCIKSKNYLVLAVHLFVLIFYVCNIFANSCTEFLHYIHMSVHPKGAPPEEIFFSLGHCPNYLTSLGAVHPDIFHLCTRISCT